MTPPFRVKEKTFALYKAVLVDENGSPVPVAQLTTLTLTLYNADVAEPSPATGNIINSRNAQNVLNVNNVTVDSGGNVAWSVQDVDNIIVDQTKATELHIARFDFTYGTPVKPGRHEVRLRVENLRKLS